MRVTVLPKPARIIADLLPGEVFYFASRFGEFEPESNSPQYPALKLGGRGDSRWTPLVSCPSAQSGVIFKAIPQLQVRSLELVEIFVREVE